ncbi:MAG: Spx/MgsR family RNA polymerase-binding regulatory protein [Opitutus sp.]
MNKLTVYTYAQCDTCRKAVKWLKEQGIAFEERPIRETPPTISELRSVFVANGSVLRKLFNTSGRDYREQKLGEKLPEMTETAAFRLLLGNGNLVKRPFVVGSGVGLVGFDAKRWAEQLVRRR